jgi:hypothetical protein
MLADRCSHTRNQNDYTVPKLQRSFLLLAIYIYIFFGRIKIYINQTTKESHQKVQATLKAMGTNNTRVLSQNLQTVQQANKRPKANRPQTKPLKEYNCKIAEKQTTTNKLAVETNNDYTPKRAKTTTARQLQKMP